ncbi:MAG: hypothetical protein WC059_02175 [Candidatus Paceibacterota bacterium]
MRTKQTGGYSVIEILIYVALFATLSIAVINSYTVVLASFGATRVNRELLEAGSTIMERMSREVRQATSVDVTSSVLGSSLGVLQLNTTDTAGYVTTSKFIIENGLLNMYTGGSLVGSLSGAHVSITNLIFRKITTTEGEAIKIELTIQNSTSKTLRTENFYNTIVLRGTY